MPELDQQITVNFFDAEVELNRNDADLVDTFVAWAKVLDGGSYEVRIASITYTIQQRLFLMRWNQDLLTTPANQITITDSIGQTWKGDAAEISEDRRRFVTFRASAIIGL